MADQAIEQPAALSTLFDKLDKKGVETLMALLQEKTVTDAAKVLQIDRTAIYYRISKYGLDKIIAQIPKQAILRLQLASVRAADTMVELLEAKDDKIKLEASKETLNRVGISGGPDVVIQSPVQINFPEEFTKYGSDIPTTPDPVDGSAGPDQVPGR